MLQQIAFPLAGIAAPLSQTGHWSSSDVDLAGTHVVLLREPQTNAAKVFMFGESGYAQKMRLWRFFPNHAARVPAQTFTDSNSVFAALPHPDGLDEDLFCSGHTVLPDGRMLLVGGSWTPPSPCGQVYALDPAWFPNAPSTAKPWAPQAAMSVERWYATATMLPNGRALVTAGTAHSTAIGFGGDVGGSGYWDKTQPLSISGRFTWADTTVVPGNAIANQPPQSRKDFYTFGLWPVGRDGHAFVGDSKGRAVLMGGLLKRAPKDSVLSDAWLMDNNIVGDDSTHTWQHMVVVGDSNLAGAIPAPRHHFAATWAGVEDRAASQEIGAVDSVTCYIQGGIDSTGHVLGDLWRGHRILAFNSGFNWVWTRLLADNTATARYGHTMSFDPGPHPVNEADSAQYARLVIFGGRKADGTLAGNHIFTYGVGKLSPDYHAWREVAVPPDTVGGPVPEAREGHAAAVRQTIDGDDNGLRQIYFFGGQRGDKTLVDATLWYLSRPDLVVADTALIDPTGQTGYKWEQVPVSDSSTATPTGRWRPAMAYNLSAKRMVIVGGDTNGEGSSGGLTSEILMVPIAENTPQTYGRWSHPVMRDPAPHPGPPPIAGFQMFGLMDAGDDIARNLESFDPAGSSGSTSTCGAEPGAWSAASTSADSLSERPIGDYPFMFVLPDGRLFLSGPTPPGSPNQNPYRRFYDLQSKLWSDTTSAGQTDAIEFGSAAMYRPGQILRAGTHGEGADFQGSSRTETISIGSGGMQAWVNYSGAGKPPMLARTNHNLTLLPTGDVLATGGLGAPTADIAHAVTQPQIWSVATGAWNDPDPVTGHPLASDLKIRNYHSTALLLPDGRVMTAGGEQPNNDRFTVSIFEPPYLFDSGDTLAARPEIHDGPETMPYARTFTVLLTDSTQGSSIKSVALLRPGAVTHGFDQNQRYVPLGFVARSNPARLLVQTPANANVAPPGEYMLFAVDSVSTTARRVPSIAKWTIVKSQTGGLDSLDMIAPRGGAVINLHDAGACTSDPSSPVLRLAWLAPADDDTIAFSGTASSYNLRYKLNSSSEANFNAWTASPTGYPSAPLSTEQVDVYGLSASTWYQFALKSVDDNNNTSGLSNIAIVKPSTTACDGGGGGFFDGGGLRSADASLTVGLDQDAPVTATLSTENTLFPGAALDSLTTDALRFPSEPRLVDGVRSVYVREGGSRGLSLDRARLLAVDHALGTESVACTDGRFLSGVRQAAIAVRDRADHDLTAEASGTAPSPIYADSGEVLRVSLPAADSTGDVLLLETSDGGLTHAGVTVEAVQQGGNITRLATVHPRRRSSTDGVSLKGARELQLRFNEACILRFAGRLAAVSQAAVASAALQAATSGDSVWTDAARERDGRKVVIPARDTLQLAFADVAATANTARDWFLVLDGTPVSATTAAFLTAQEEGGPAAPLRFALRQNIPNPFRHTTLIGFDLPAAGEVRLEIFDAQGRKVWSHTARFEAGRHAIEWNLRDGRGHGAAPGIYAYRLRAGGLEARRKMVVLP